MNRFCSTPHQQEYLKIGLWACGRRRILDFLAQHYSSCFALVIGIGIGECNFFLDVFPVFTPTRSKVTIIHTVTHTICAFAYVLCAYRRFLYQFLWCDCVAKLKCLRLSDQLYGGGKFTCIAKILWIDWLYPRTGAFVVRISAATSWPCARDQVASYERSQKNFLSILPPRTLVRGCGTTLVRHKTITWVWILWPPTPYLQHKRVNIKRDTKPMETFVYVIIDF